MRKLIVVLALTAGLAYTGQAFACDLCGIYSATEAKESKPGFYASVFEQYTHFGTLQKAGVEVPDPAKQFLNSSITQFIVGYQFGERFGLQLNVPYIRRTFKRPMAVMPMGYVIDRGAVAGLGDISLVGNLRAYEYFKKGVIFVWNVQGGVKFPTGSTERLKETLSDMGPMPGVPPSGIGGHDLTLGSGSYDGIIGSTVALNWKRFFVTSGVQYAIRTTGDFDYRFANDLNWHFKPGYFLLVSDDATLGIALSVTGEAKGKDVQFGMEMDDTADTSVFIGPDASFTYKDMLSANLGVGLPVIDHNTSLQSVPDYKVIAAVTVRF